MTPTRETFGNIPLSSQLAFYGLAMVAMGIFCWGVWRRWKLWRLGTPIAFRELISGNLAAVWKKIRPGARRVVVDAGAQQRVRGHGLGTVAHVSLYVGFMALLAGTTLLEADNILSHVSGALKFHRGLYYVIYEYTLDVLGLAFLAGTLFFCWRRLRRPAALGHRPTDWYVLVSFLAIGVTGYLVEALRILWSQPTGITAHCSPVGLWLAGIFDGLTVSATRRAHFAVWWIHSFLVFGFIASIPFTRLFHFIAGPMNIFLAAPSLGQLAPVTMEEVEQTGRVGPSDIRHFSRQQLLSLDACMECGRCEEVCPAFATAKPLSPKRVVQDLKGLMEATGAALAAGKTEGPALHETTIAAETLWSCTACSACVNVCPVRIDQLALIIGLRRHLVAEGGLSGTAATALRRMQSNGNPWGLPPVERANWRDGLAAKS
ncbi:MAG: 4Fe-4S dicluster domain-containing protein [bacterium]|nr:4Fe-4S dicluster domain-containing protein [bacterium]MDI1337258.1 4Fe-4S dicluster domain-containing protein [Lacunisphaera sp.]